MITFLIGCSNFNAETNLSAINFGSNTPQLNIPTVEIETVTLPSLPLFGGNISDTINNLLDEMNDIFDSIINPSRTMGTFVDFLDFELGKDLEDAILKFGEPFADVSVDVLGVETRTLSWLTIGSWITLPTTITATFTNSTATSVIETFEFLSDFDVEVALAIENGISEVEAFEMLGVPYSITHIRIPFLGDSVTVNWIDSQFHSVLIIFVDGLATSVTRLGFN